LQSEPRFLQELAAAAVSLEERTCRQQPCLPLRWELMLSQLALCSAPPLGAHLTLAVTYASRRRHRHCRRCRWTLIKPPQPGPPLATRTSGKYASTPHAMALEAEAAPLSIVGYGVAPQLHLAAADVRSSSSLLLSPLTVDSDQATATGTASGHTHKQKAHSTKHSGVAARTRLRRERGGNSFQLAQLQPTTPKHTGASRQPRSRGCWLDITAEENYSSNANY
jgi:hypothetical protein